MTSLKCATARQFVIHTSTHAHAHTQHIHTNTHSGAYNTLLTCTSCADISLCNTLLNVVVSPVIKACTHIVLYKVNSLSAFILDVCTVVLVHTVQQ